MRILVVEDDAALSRQLADALGNSGFVVDTAFDGDEGCFLGDVETYDAVVLDLGLPGMDGLSVLKSWRANGNTAPVLILTARASWSEKVDGLDAGADDYVAKPFRMEELIARIRALIRRSSGSSSSIIECGKLVLDTRASTVSHDGAMLTLTAQEYRILSYLIHHRGKMVSRTELIDHIYGKDGDRDSNTIEVYIGRLRRKIPDNPIKTVRGLGYRLGEPA